MARITQADRRKLSRLAELASCNPFTQQRIALEQEILGDQFVADGGIAWSRRFERQTDRPNIPKITKVATDLVAKFRESDDRDDYTETVLEEYWDVATYVLLYAHLVIHEPAELLKPKTTANIWRSFLAEYRELRDLPGLPHSDLAATGHLFACLTQVRRAFRHIYDYILGDSLPAVGLRRAVWESIFTNDLQRYRRSLFDRLGNLPTLITGPSGTGKELAARAIGLSQYIPFDVDRERFVDSEKDLFFPLNLSAMSATLIESELFGHCKGAFTGAVADRNGWLDQCKPYGAVFLDEIGELETSLQVKLLRVVQQRKYVRVGETKERTFTGKLIGATNRDLGVEMTEGRFREDLYYRMCADRIETPGLREQLDDRPQDLRFLTLHIASRLAGDDAQALCDETVNWIESHLGADYPWRGNIRELEQCVSSVLIRGTYAPSTSRGPVNSSGDTRKLWLNEIGSGELTADEVLQRYCTWVYSKTGSYEATARQVGLDRRTVKSRVDEKLLAQLQK